MKRFITSLSVVILSVLVLLLGAQPLLAAKANESASKAISAQKAQKNILHLKLRNPEAVSLVNGDFKGQPAADFDQLNAILSSAKRVKAEKLLDGPVKTDVQARAQQATAGYYKVTFAKDIDVAAITEQLKGLSIVETAYAEPKAAPSPTSPNYQSLQNYLAAAPGGVNSGYAKTFPGGAGNNVKIVDLEYSWNTNHEDLSKARTALLPNATPSDPFNSTDHGTAVLGEMVADDNGFGVTGITPKAGLGLVNVNTTDGYKLVGALYTAAAYTQPGDVIVVEQQAWGPTDAVYDFVPVEWVPEVYDIIKSITDSGRVVVEAAGNGNQNLDDSSIYGTSFPMGKADSGAIIVGAGLNCSGNPLRSRMDGSTYGKRVNLQGPANCVVSTGYGDMDYTASTNALYTQYFNGTSSATPVVAASAASLSSAYKALNGGKSLTPSQVRSILMQNGTSQNISGSGALTGNIGPLPDLAKALLKADTTKPTAPTNVKVVLNSSHQPVLSWNASADNNQIASYKIYRNGNLYKTVSGTTTTYTSASVVVGKTYKYVIYAVDPSGNKSAASTAVSITVK